MADIPVGRVTSLVRTAPERFSVTGSVPIKGLLDRERADGAREEREAVVAALKRRRAFLAEFFEPGEVRLRDDELAELLRIIEAGEHRKEVPDA